MAKNKPWVCALEPHEFQACLTVVLVGINCEIALRQLLGSCSALVVFLTGFHSADKRTVYCVYKELKLQLLHRPVYMEFTVLCVRYKRNKRTRLLCSYMYGLCTKLHICVNDFRTESYCDSTKHHTLLRF